jgi:thioredoxin reductase (NADPH)
LFVTQGATPETRLAEDLGVRLDDDGYIEVDIEQRTSEPEVFAADDVTSLYWHQVTAVAHQGGEAASAANFWLYPPEPRG